MNNFSISNELLEQLFNEFTDFLKAIAGESFTTFKKSNYVDEQEHYKYSIYNEAKRLLGNRDWKPEDIGTGRIQKAVESAILKKVIHNNRSVENNLIHWMKKDNFSKLGKNKELEQSFFDFYKNKITPQRAFEEFIKYFDYQLIAYLFFMNNKEQYLPIAQATFDRIISDKLNISDFKTSGNISWENYKTFLEIIKQAHKFLKTKDKDATLLDAHSFLWILGRQREEWLNKQSPISKPNNKEVNASVSVLNDKINLSNPSHFFQYWQLNQVESDMASGGNLRHAGSNQFKRRNIKVGDTVWVVTVKTDGQLYLVGRMVVDQFVDKKTALEMFTNEVIDRDVHIVVNEENSEPFREVNLMDIADDLRFISNDSDRLDIIDGKVDGRQLQTIRELTTESINLIKAKWNIDNDEIESEDFEIDENLGEEEEIIRQLNIPETEKEQLIKVRRGQEKFRINLEKVEKGCRLTGITDKRFLIASHIKAWVDSTNEEKLDGNNGLWLSPHADKLFDRGWISFSDDGKILCQNEDIENLMKIWGLDYTKSVGNFNDKQKSYLAYHREKYNFD